MLNKINFRSLQFKISIKPKWRAAGFTVIALVILVMLYRAYSQSLTYDESASYLKFVQHGLNEIRVKFHSNNHTLNSILMFFSVKLFGLSNLTVRLPALMGGLLYLIALENFLSRTVKTFLPYILGLLMLSLNPFILDYLIAARGYALATGFLMTALALGWVYLTSRSGMKILVLISLSASFSVLSNLSFAFVNASLLIILAVGIGWRFITAEGKKTAIKTALLQMLALSIPGGMTYLLINPSILKYFGGTMYFGSPTWLKTYKSVFGEFFLSNFDFEILNQVATYLPYIFGIFLLGFGGFLALNIVHSIQKKTSLPDIQISWLYTAGILTAALLLFQIAHMRFGLLFPKERTGIYLIILAGLLITLSVSGFRKQGWLKFVSFSGLLLMGIMVISFSLSQRTDYFAKWKYDSGTQEIYAVFREMDLDWENTSVSVDWHLESSLNMYRKINQDDHIPAFERNDPISSHEVFILSVKFMEEKPTYLEDNQIQLYYQHPVSKALIGIKE